MNVFISYRRKDAQYIAGSIYYWLEHEFGPDHLFKDVDTIPPGRDFRRILQDAVTRCDVLLVVIGPRWLGETDVAGRRRVDDPEDWVRIEIETALERSIPVIPLLVDEASFPRGEDLPPSLQGLVYRNGIPVRPDPDFRHDMGRLIKALRKYERKPQNWWTTLPGILTAAAGIMTALTGLFVMLYQVGVFPHAPPVFTTLPNSKDALAYLNRGNTWYDKREYDKAIADYNTAIALDPKLAAASAPPVVPPPPQPTPSPPPVVPEWWRPRPLPPSPPPVVPERWRPKIPLPPFRRR